LRTVVHLSDLHFGDTQDAVVEPLIAKINELTPDLVAVSGDLTQRARTRQFQSARRFLDALPAAKIVVPGNHDVPLYNVFARMRGLEKYRRHLGQDLEPFYADGEIAVLGVNTARSLAFKGGRINKRQLRRVQERFCGIDEQAVKMIVSHHPFDLPEAYPPAALVGRAGMALVGLAECKVDLFLAGHFHVGLATPTASRFKLGGRLALIVQAGTATSNRGRGEANSFNVIRVRQPYVSVERFEWQSRRQTFVSAASGHFRRNDNGWSRIPSSDLRDEASLVTFRQC
jgi:3',5'-cyclic AMP phosphodiesterase CpdA